MFRVCRVIVIISICSATVIDSTVKEDQIRFVSAVFRHGDRAPASPEIDRYPKDPYYNDTFYPVGLGGLTNEGKRRTYKLGQMLRERYNDFLGDIYIPEEVEAHSSDLVRTKMSLQLVLAGLYPPAEIQRWSSDINWQPIQTTYAPVQQDNFFLVQHSCPKYVEELGRVESSPEVAEVVAEFRPIMEKLTIITGRPIKEVYDMFTLYHGLAAEVAMNLTLPEWTKEFFPNGTLLDGANLEYKLLNWNNLLRRLNGGMLVKRMIEDMKAVVANDTSTGRRKINLFSGHELNIAGLLNTLGLYKPHVPQYSSAVIVELFRRGDVHYVKVIRYLGIPPVFEDQEIPNCGRLCPLDTFIKLMREVTPSDVEKECKRDSNAIPKSKHINYLPGCETCL